MALSSTTEKITMVSGSMWLPKKVSTPVTSAVTSRMITIGIVELQQESAFQAGVFLKAISFSPYCCRRCAASLTLSPLPGSAAPRQHRLHGLRPGRGRLLV
jgi:hypothetical protein